MPPPWPIGKFPMTDPIFRCGSIAIVGRPNAGKSTLLNQLIGQKISITSRKPQTTRHRLLGIVTQPDAQFLFLDTPGLQTHYKSALNKAMARSIASALEEADVILWVLEGLDFDTREQYLRKLLPANRPVVAAINKIDGLAEKPRLLPHLARLATEFSFAAMVPVSAKQRSGLDDLLKAIKTQLPERLAVYGADEMTDRNERFLAAEAIREKLMRNMGDEIPYSAHVDIIQFKIENDTRHIEAEIIVTRDNHKAMVIGKGGEKLKTIGSAARLDLEKLFGGKVYLGLWVKVKNDWIDDQSLLRAYGYS
jgi:GTPase